MRGTVPVLIPAVQTERESAHSPPGCGVCLPGSSVLLNHPIAVIVHNWFHPIVVI